MKKILIVNANYYEKISSSLINNSKKTLKNFNARTHLIDVPGVFEIPFTIRKYINIYDAFIVLGCVIKGETPHFELICKSTFDAIIRLSVDFKKPIGNGIITALNMKQALARSSSVKNSLKSNKGYEATRAIISILKNEPKKL